MSDTKNPQNPSGERSARAGGVAYMDQALWKQLGESRDQGEFLHAWLELQTRMIHGVSGGVVVLGDPDSQIYSVSAVWPQGSNPRPGLVEVTEKVLETRKGVATREGPAEEDGEEAPLQMGYPIRLKGAVAGVAAFTIAARPKDQLQVIMRQMQWGLAWVENWLLRTRFDLGEDSHSRVAAALDLTAVTLQEKGYKAAAAAFVTQLAARLECDRVSLGVSRRGHIRVTALSHTAQFNRQMNLVRAIGAAMTESLDQGEPLVYPDPAGQGLKVLKAHQELASLVGDGAAATVPFMDGQGNGYGALTMERTALRPFTAEELELADTLAALVGPILEEKRANDRWLALKALDSLRKGLGALVGPGHLVVKAAAAVLAAAAVFLAVARGDYRVTARTAVEGQVQRAVVAPYDGFLYEAPVRAGDTVREGQVLCSLDDRDQKLERLRWAGQREQLQRQYREAMAEGNRANVKILGEQISQADAQINLLDEQLARARIVAPFDGIVITGDLSQALGSPVQRGQLFFEIAPLQDYRLRLRVDEREINQIRVGQTGTLVLNSLPEKPFPMTVTKITPLSAAEEGRNLFFVEGDLDGADPSLRPGMEGFAKVSVDRRRLLWIWTHDLVDWARLWVWSWWP